MKGDIKLKEGWPGPLHLNIYSITVGIAKYHLLLNSLTRFVPVWNSSEAQRVLFQQQIHFEWTVTLNVVYKMTHWLWCHQVVLPLTTGSDVIVCNFTDIHQVAAVFAYESTRGHGCIFEQTIVADLLFRQLCLSVLVLNHSTVPWDHKTGWTVIYSRNSALKVCHCVTK